MKKMFLALAAASLVSTMAFAQDDYDYGDDYGTEASTSSDDGYTDMDSGDKAAAEEKPASDVEYKNMDEGKKVSRNEGEMSSIFDRPYNLGARISLGLADFYNTPKTVNPETGVEEDAMKGWMGVQVALGFIFNYHINNMFSIVPELNFEVRDYFSDADGYYAVYDDYGYYAGVATDVQYNLRQFNLNIPVMVRYNPTPQIFIEAGAAFSVNLYADYALTSDEYGIDETLDDWECSSTAFALQFGAGYTLGIGNNKFGDIGARFVLDMTKLEPNGDTKTWSLQFFVTGYTPM